MGKSLEVINRRLDARICGPVPSCCQAGSGSIFSIVREISDTGTPFELQEKVSGVLVWTGNSLFGSCGKGASG
jgi:hypothetical protein